jgi:16S rRNA processing protein RimM
MIVDVFRLGSPKGLRGLQKVYSLGGGDPQAYGLKQQWYLQSPADKDWSLTEVEHLCSKYIKLAHVNDIDAAKRYTHGILGIEENELPSLAQDEYYYKDLVNKDIINQDQALLGKVLEVINSPAHDILVFEHQGKKHFIPFVAAHVLEVGEAIHVYWDTDEDWCN